ncbi:hypothetical protein V8F20_002232 [Naviculisporaceae sp. PSN 640]
MRLTSVLLLFSGFLGIPGVTAGPISKSSIGRPWLRRAQEEKTRERYQQHQQQVVLFPVKHQADRPPLSPQANDNDNDQIQQSRNITLPKWLHKYTSGFVAFGDSYSAGIGTTIPAGTQENACRQGAGAYPFLIYTDFLKHFSNSTYPNNTNDLGHNTTQTSPSFQWLSCTGSTTHDVLSSPSSSRSDSQIDSFNFTSSSSSRGGSNTKFATLSIGGNDVGFFDVINACIFRFYAFYSGTCEEALTRSERLVAAALEYIERSHLLSSFLPRANDGTDGDGDGDRDEDEKLAQQGRLLAHKITLILLEILDKVHWERHSDFRIIVTGYARFFNAETVPCDEASLGVWWDSSTGNSPSKSEDMKGNSTLNDEDGDLEKEGLSSYRPKLKREVRKRMNALVEGVNQLLEEITMCVNAGFTPPDISITGRSDDTRTDAGSRSEKRRVLRNKTRKRVIFVDYDHLFEGHRLCEKGVNEPDYKRAESWFFLPGGGDNLPLEPAPLPSPSPGPDSWADKAEPKVDKQKVHKREREAILSKEDSHLVDPDTCLEGIMAREENGELSGEGDWGSRALCYMAIVKKKNPHLVLDSRLVPGPKSAVMGTDRPRPLNRDSMWYVPTYYGKTFHPRSLAHRAITDRIYEVWANEEKDDGA